MKRLFSYGFELQGTTASHLANIALLVSLFIAYVFSRNELFIYAALSVATSVLLFNLRFARWAG